MENKGQKLRKCTELLYRKVGKMNLYISFCREENGLDHIRLKREAEQIKKLISDIETQIGRL